MLRRPCVVRCRPSIIFKDLLLQNRCANQSQISCGASVDRGNESLFGASGTLLNYSQRIFRTQWNWSPQHSSLNSNLIGQNGFVGPTRLPRGQKGIFFSVFLTRMLVDERKHAAWKIASIWQNVTSISVPWDFFMIWYASKSETDGWMDTWTDNPKPIYPPPPKFLGHNDAITNTWEHMRKNDTFWADLLFLWPWPWP